MTVRITVDRTVCEQHGLCVAQAPDIFRFDESGQLQPQPEVGDDRLADVEDAVFLCPTQALSFTRES